MSFSVNVSGLFDSLSPTPLFFSGTSGGSGSLPAEISATGTFPTGAPDPPAVGTRNHICNLIAASRTEHCSIAATKSRTLPPTRPRVLMHDFDWHAHAPPTPLFRVAVKLSLLVSDPWVGSGHFPRSVFAFIRRNGMP